MIKKIGIIVIIVVYLCSCSHKNYEVGNRVMWYDVKIDTTKIEVEYE